MSGTAAIEEVDRIVETGGDADDILRDVVGALVDPGGCSWAGILFVESGELVLGPQAGVARAGDRIQVPVVFEGSRVAELAVDGCDDPPSSTGSPSSSRRTASSAGTPTASHGRRD